LHALAAAFYCRNNTLLLGCDGNANPFHIGIKDVIVTPVHARLACSIMSAVLLSAILAGCYTPYKAPHTADSATMTVHNASSGKISLTIYRDATECKGPERVAPMFVGGERRTIYLPTRAELAMSTGQDLGARASGAGGLEIYGCANAISFVPEAGRTYFLEIGQQRACNMLVSEKRSPRERVPVPTEVVQRKFIRPFTQEGAFCARR
jgi:hypothetical protein